MTSKTVFTVSGLKELKIEVDCTQAQKNDPLYKKILRHKAIKNLPFGFVPFHGTVVFNQNHSFLISGASDSGKTILAKTLEKYGYRCLAHDFVITWLNQNNLFAGDFNYVENNIGKTSLKIDKIILLIPEDKRDCFQLNKGEFKKFYFKSLLPSKPDFLKKFFAEGVVRFVLENHFALGNRQNVERWEKTVLGILDKKKEKNIRMGIIGLGTVGQEVTSILLLNKSLKCFNIFSPNQNKLGSVLLDLKSCTSNAKINQFSSPDEIFENSDFIIICFRVLEENLDKTQFVFKDERVKRIYPHAKVVWELSRIIRKSCFGGKIFVVTNPVDMISWLFYWLSNLNDEFLLDWNGLLSDQVYGIGLGLDYLRLLTVSKKSVECLGEHGEGLFLARKMGQKLILKKDKGTLDLVKTYSNRVRQYTDRTKFGPAHEIARVIDCFEKENCQDPIRISALDKKGVFYGNIFKLKDEPVSFYEYSSEIERKINSFRNDQLKIYVEIVNFLKQTVKITKI